MPFPLRSFHSANGGEFLDDTALDERTAYNVDSDGHARIVRRTSPGLSKRPVFAAGDLRGAPTCSESG
jgi:hypothetical protein